MNRRLFLASMVAAGGSMMLRRSAFGESGAPASRPSSAAQQAELIRAAASQFLQALSPERHSRVLFAFPVGQTATAARFPRTGGMGGPRSGPRGGGGPGSANGASSRSVDRDRDGGFKFDQGPPGGPPNDGGPRGGQGMGPGGFAFVGEKYGQAVWSNFPVSDVPRPGVRMGEFTAAEREAAHGLLRAVLSPMGYQKVLDIMAADQTLADAGTPYASGVDAYTIALLGPPSETSPWMLEFGGHHLGLNIIFVGDKAVCAPLHTGILPSKFSANGRIVRALGRENDKAFDLFATFTPQQVKSAVIEHDVSDLLCGPGRPTVNFPMQGLRGSDMTGAQQQMMFELSQEWVGILNDALSAQRLEAFRKSLPDTYFAWSGSTTHDPGENGEEYFRIHGPSLLIEHAPQGNQGGYKLHVHTVMRDLQNDYAKQLI